MQELAFPRRKGILAPVSVLVLLILPLVDLPSANGSCEFPSDWTGEWYLYGKPPFVINSTVFGDKTCVEAIDDKYLVHFNVDNCYLCMIINQRHDNVIQYREATWCSADRTSFNDMCSLVASDDQLDSIFRVNSKPIPCPFVGASFTFTYSKSAKAECTMPISLAEKCTDESKLLFKFQACPDVEGTESNTEELQCHAVWNDGRNKYMVGTLKGRNAVGNSRTYRCFLYEEKAHHQGKMYLIAQSGDPTCNGLTSIAEGSLIMKLAKADKEHKCKYPAWVTQHHDWHSLDGTKVYHFTNKNATLKVKAQSHDAQDGETLHEEKIVCHNLEHLYPNDNMQGNKVKLIAHVTSGCDVGYVCMIFHRRDSHIIEIQQSEQKAIMPDEACSISDPSTMPYTTLITTFLHQRKCPNPGRYAILDFAPSHAASAVAAPRRQRRSEPAKTTKRRTWQDNTEDEECRNTHIQVGCTSSDQTEMIIVNTCEHEEIAYYCHGSWEDKGTWYTIAAQRNPEFPVGLGEAFCFTMRQEGVNKASGRSGRLKQQEQEFWLSRPSRTCQREAKEEWTYRLSSQGVCEDLTKAASSLASIPSSSLSSLLLALYAVAYIATNTLRVLLSR